MTDYEFATVAAHRMGCTKQKAHQATKAILGTFSDAILAGGRSIRIPGFGRFVIKQRPAIRRSDPRDRIVKVFPPRTYLKFLPNEEFARRIAELDPTPTQPLILTLPPTEHATGEPSDA